MSIKNDTKVRMQPAQLVQLYNNKIRGCESKPFTIFFDLYARVVLCNHAILLVQHS